MRLWALLGFFKLFGQVTMAVAMQGRLVAVFAKLLADIGLVDIVIHYHTHLNPGLR